MAAEFVLEVMHSPASARASHPSGSANSQLADSVGSTGLLISVLIVSVMAGAVGWVVVGVATVAGVLRYHGVLPSFLRTAVPEAGMVSEAGWAFSAAAFSAAAFSAARSAAARSASAFSAAARSAVT